MAMSGRFGAGRTALSAMIIGTLGAMSGWGLAVTASALPQAKRHPLAAANSRLNPIDSPAGLIVKCKRIWTGNREHPWAQALAARDGAIVAVGTPEEIERFRGPATRVIEFPAALATPGLIDAHGHLESLGASQEEVDLRGVTSLEEVARRVKARADATPADSWITGRNWDQSLWPGRRSFPTAAVLDNAAPDRAGLASARRRPCRLGQLRGHAPGRSVTRTRRPRPTARSCATPQESRPASSSTAPWVWSAEPSQPPPKPTRSADCSPPRRSSCKTV